MSHYHPIINIRETFHPERHFGYWPQPSILRTFWHDDITPSAVISYLQAFIHSSICLLSLFSHNPTLLPQKSHSLVY